MDLVEEVCLIAHDLADNNEPDEAMRLISKILTEHPHDWRPLSVAGYIEHKCERFGLAYNLLKRACELMPNKSELLNNLGMSALGCMNLEDAERELKQALRLKPDNIGALNNLALVYVNKGEPGLALEYSNKAMAIEADPGTLETKGYAHLMLGQWNPGWECFEGALNGKIRRPVSYQGEPYWDGSKCDTLVVRGEQGIGDEISFASVIPDAATRAKRVVIECDSRLYGLFKRSFPEFQVYGTRFLKTQDWKENPDYHCLSGSLCQYFRLTDESFPGTPYLVADPERRLQWRALLDSLGSRPKIGIAWSGGRHGTHRERRSLKLEELLPILRQDATFISLAYKDASREIAELKDKHGVEVKHWPRATEYSDYDDTAALVAELDLVISVQTAAVHLSGALGKTCWAMIPSKPLWRYKLTGDSVPWYKSVKIYRQKRSWEELINRIANDLSSLYAETGGIGKTSSPEASQGNRVRQPAVHGRGGSPQHAGVL